MEMENAILDYRAVWSRCLDVIKDNVDANAFTTWFEPIVPAGLKKDGTLVLQVPSHTYYDVLENNYVNLLKRVIRKELGANGKLEYRVVMLQGMNSSNPKTINLPSHNKPAVENQMARPAIDVYNRPVEQLLDPRYVPGIRKRSIPSNLNDSLTFDNYVEGDCNRLARAAGWAISKAPGSGTAFNPLFIYSDVGLGKTHLANAIGLQTKVNFPDKVVVYISSDLFVQQYLESVKNNNRNDFVFFYQNVDVLIVDDIQFLATGNKERTQEVFFHIFNHLYTKGKQIILTSDKSPVDLTGFEPRLLNRFKWGLTADLQVPDFETRIAILRKKLDNQGIEFPQEVIEDIALRVTSNIREMEGAMIAILAQVSLNKREVTIDLAREMIDKYVKSTAKDISIEYIQKIICDYFKIPIDQINTTCRKREISQARQLSMYFARKHTKLPLSSIGEHCGHRDHATVLHACRTIENLLETDKKMKSYVEDIEKRMKI